MRSAGWLFLLCCFIAGSTSAQKNDDAKKLLEAVARRYDKAKAFSIEGTITTMTKSPSAETKVVTKISMVFQRPNKFRVVFKDQKGQVQQVIVSDGTNVFWEFPALKQTMRRPAPKSGIPLPAGGLLAGSFSEQLARVKKAQVIGEEKLGRRKAKVIKVVANDGTTATFWIADNAIWQTKVTIEGKRFASGVSSKGQPNPFAEAMKQTTITQIITFAKVSFNPRLEPNLFTYKPPPGFKVVEKLEMPGRPLQGTKPKP